MRDLIRLGYAQQGELVWCCGYVREQAEEVFRIQLLPCKCARDVDAALDIGSEEGGVDGFGLWQ